MNRTRRIVLKSLFIWLSGWITGLFLMRWARGEEDQGFKQRWEDAIVSTEVIPFEPSRDRREPKIVRITNWCWLGQEGAFVDEYGRYVTIQYDKDTRREYRFSIKYDSNADAKFRKQMMETLAQARKQWKSTGKPL